MDGVDGLSNVLDWPDGPKQYQARAASLKAL